MLDELLQVGDRALIFAQFAEMEELLKQHLQEHFAQEALLLHGGVSKPKREHMVDRFQNESDAPGMPQDLLGDLRLADANAALARRLGPFPFWRGQTDFWQTIERIYKLAATSRLKSLGSDGGITKPER